MGKRNIYKVRELHREDIPDVVQLFNKNKVYQFLDNIPLSEKDFIETMKVKEVSHFFILEKFGQIIGTTAFFKFISFGSIDDCYTYSGYLLIDSAHRTGAAIHFFQKKVLMATSKLGFRLHFTEISRYNKASLTLSKHNGFTLFKESYEDIYHCYLLRSVLPKILKAFTLKGKIINEYDMNTFKVIQQRDRGEYTEISTNISNEDIVFKVFPAGQSPFDIHFSFIRVYIFKKDNRLFFKSKFYSDEVLQIELTTDEKAMGMISRENPQIELFSSSNEIFCTANITTTKGNILANLHYSNMESRSKLVPVHQTFLSYHLEINLEDGDLYIIEKDGDRVLIEDPFLQFSKPVNTKFYSEEYPGKIIIKCIGSGVDIEKILLLDGSSINVQYIFKDINVSKKIYAKYGLKFRSQNYLIKEKGKYRAYIPGIFPDESDDFVRENQIRNKEFQYHFPKEKLQLSYQTNNRGSNQVQFRPLVTILLQESKNNIHYSLHFRQMDIEHLNLSKIPELLLKKVNFSGHLLKNIKCYGQTMNSSIRYDVHETKNKMNYVLNQNAESLMLQNFSNNSSAYTIFEFDYVCASKVQFFKYGESYLYSNKGPTWEIDEELLIFEEANSQYTSFKIFKGSIYSYKENNKLKIRCVIPNQESVSQNVKISQFIGG